MRTKIKFDEIERIFEEVLVKLLDARLERIHTKLDNIGNTSGQYSKDLREIKDKLDDFISIIKHFSKEQKILIKKMREIEDYFDPQVRN